MAVAPVSDESDGGDRLDGDVEALFHAKADAELSKAAGALAGGAFSATGDPAAAVLLLKGEPGPVDLAAGRALAGPDADAATASLEALGLPTDWLGLITRAPDGRPADINVLRRAVEACDPAWVLALDAPAAQDAAGALGVGQLPFGRPMTLRGRTWLALDGLEASLSDPARKRRVWAQLKTVSVL
jgi:hypothetical protein